MNKIARSNSGKHVPSVQLVHDRAWQPRCGSNGHAFNRLGWQWIKDPLSGSKPRMHSFEEVWWSSPSRFEHCAMHSAIRSAKFTPIGAVGLRAVTRDFVLVAHARIAPISVQPFNGGLGKGPCMLSGMLLAKTRTPPERSDNSRGGSREP